jgi:hypothetical protein
MLNDAAAVNVDVTVPPPAVAVDNTFTVHTEDDVCTIDEIDEIPVRSKSVPAVTDNVAQSMSSSPVTIKLIDAEDEVADTALNVTVGAVISRTIVVVAVAADTGPVFPARSVAPFTANTGMTVPALHPDTVTVRLLPESLPGSNEHPVAVPEFEKSPAATPVTLSENVKV